jgi:glutamyl-tRNA reductase
MTDEDDGGRRADDSTGAPEGVPEHLERDAIADRIRDYSEDVRNREQAVALRKLSAHGDVTDRQREALSEMTAGIVDGLLSTPEAALREADERTLRAAVRMYGIDPSEYVSVDGD